MYGKEFAVFLLKVYDDLLQNNEMKWGPNSMWMTLWNSCAWLYWAWLPLLLLLSSNLSQELTSEPHLTVFLRKCPSNCISGAKVILRQYLRSRIRLLVVKTFCRSHCATNHNWHSNKWEKEVTKSWQQFWKNVEFSRKGRVNSPATENLYCCKQCYRLRFLCRGYHD